MTRCQAGVMLLGVPLGQCRATATTLIEVMCRHEHHAIRELCAWHTESALSTNLPYCSRCWDVDGHWCPIAARILPGKVGGRGEEGSRDRPRR